MDDKQYKILEHLYPTNLNAWENISPILVKQFAVETNKIVNKLFVLEKLVYPTLDALTNNYYIEKRYAGELEKKQLARITDNTTDWFDTIPYEVRIRPEGRKAYEDEYARRMNLALLKSQTETNATVEKANVAIIEQADETIKLYRLQRGTIGSIIAFTFVSALGAGLSAWAALKSYNLQKSQMSSPSAETLKEIESLRQQQKETAFYLEGLKLSIEKRKKDTVFVVRGK